MLKDNSKFWVNSDVDSVEWYDFLPRALQQVQLLAPAAGFGTFMFALIVYPVIAFVLAVATVRISPRGWTGRIFRK